MLAVIGLGLLLTSNAVRGDSFPTNVYALGDDGTNVYFLGSNTTNLGGLYPDTLGLMALRTLVTNLNGSGVRVAQAEASAPVFEVNPTNSEVSQPVSRFTFINGSSSATGFPNSLGTESGHSDNVAGDFYGMRFGVATNIAHVDNYDANTLVYNSVLYDNPIAARVVNQSFTYGAYYSFIDSAFDNYADEYGVLFISGAGFNNGPVYSPATCFNGIAVGVYNNPGSSYGPTPDGRCKPDITAWGNQDTVTSYSTPLVAGSAAVLLQAGARGDGGVDTNSATDLRTIKALLLNGAVKPLGWSNSPSVPLHYVYGAGIVNLLNSYEQLVGGKHGYVTSHSYAAGLAHAPSGASPASFAQTAVGSAPLRGWDFNAITSSSTADVVNHYYFSLTNASAGATFTATATLVWDLQNGQAAINNLGLFLYNASNGQLITCSTSLVDNVQHVYLPSLAPGVYDLQVWMPGSSAVTPSENYALAYEFFSQSVTMTPSGTNVVISWPVYPAGFLVEATTNLSWQNWVAQTNLTPVLSGGQYQVTVPSINPASITFYTVTNVVSGGGINIGPGPTGPGDTTNVTVVPVYNQNLDLHYYRLRRPNL